MIEIQLAKEEDLKQLAYIEEVCFPVKEAATLAQFQKRFQAFPECFMVAIVEGRIVGFINGAMIAKQTLSDEMYEDTSYHNVFHAYQSVYGLAVLPAFRHMGIAKKLMQSFINLSKSRQKKGMVLTCKETLIPFYQQCGYTCLGVSHSIHGGAKWYDMIFEFDLPSSLFIPMQFYHLKEAAILFQQCFDNEPWNEQWTYQQAYQHLEEMLSSPYTLAYVLYQNGQFIGMIVGHQMTYMDKQVLCIDELCVCPQLHGQHIGSQLLDYIKEECHKRKIQKIVLQTIRSYLSDYFYKCHGFYEQDYLVSMTCDIKNSHEI